MGEYAEYMLNGDDCQVCGEYMGNGDGYPRTCRSCSKPEGRDKRESLFICIKPAALVALPKWLQGRPSFNVVDAERKDKRGQPMIVVHYDEKPDSDWGKIRAGSKSVIICSEKTLPNALAQVRKAEAE